MPKLRHCLRCNTWNIASQTGSSGQGELGRMVCNRLWIIILTCWHLSFLCYGQGSIRGSYLYLPVTAKKGTVVGNATEVRPLDPSSAFSIESVTYYIDDINTPLTVQDLTWRRPKRASLKSNDCQQSEGYVFPRNLFCIQYSTGSIMTTSQFESRRPRGASSFVLEIYIDVAGEPGRTPSSKTVIRIVPDCLTSASNYTQAVKSCNRVVTNLANAREGVNGTYTYVSPSGLYYEMVALTLYLGRLKNTSLQVGTQLKFKICRYGKVSFETYFNRTLLASAVHENSVMFFFSSLLSLQLINTISVELRNGEDQPLSGSVSAIILHLFEGITDCNAETCLVPLGDWLKLPVNINNPECPVLTDASFLIPKYKSCLANQPPVSGAHPEIRLRIPNLPGQHLLVVNATDPENTVLSYQIMLVGFTSIETGFSVTCSYCNYFEINSTGTLTAISAVSGLSGDKYTLAIKVTDSGRPSRSVTIFQSIFLEDQCGNATILYRSFVVAGCLADEPPFTLQGPSKNVTVLVYQYEGPIYKVIKGYLDVQGLTNALPPEIQQLLLQVMVCAGTKSCSLVREKNITQVLEKGKSVYLINLDIRVDSGQVIATRIYGVKNGSSPQLLRTDDRAFKISAYSYQPYCNNEDCVKNFQNWVNTVTDIKSRGINGCDSDPRFLRAYYQHCLEPPRITIHPPQETAVVLNSNVVMYCDYFSFSKSAVLWFKDGLPFTAVLKPAKRKRREEMPPPANTKSFLLSATLENQGEYYCLAQNAHGKAASNKGLIRLTDVITSKFTLRITDRTYNTDYANKSSDAFKAISAQLTQMIQHKFGSERTGVPGSVVAINNIKPGSVIVDANVYSTGVLESSRRSQACSGLIRAIDQGDFGDVKVDMERSELMVYDCCNVSTTGFVEEKGRFQWLITDSHDVRTVQCPYGSNDTVQNATRQCVYRYGGQASWEEPNTTKCAYLRQTTADLALLAQTAVNTRNVVNISQRLVNLTSGKLTNRLDISFSTTTIENILNILDARPKIATNVLQGVSNIMASSQKVVSLGQVYFNTSSRILRSIQKAADIVELQSKKPFITKSFKNLALFVAEPPKILKEGLTVVATLNAASGKTNLFSEQFEKLPNSVDQALGSLFLPEKVLLESAKKVKHLRVSSIFFKNSKLFASNVSVQEDTEGVERTSTTRINTFVLDAAIRDLTLEGLTDKVVSRFKPLDKDAKGSLTCVFWDFLDGGGNGAWSSRGCSNVVYEKGFYRCQCDHLTHFGVLLDLSGTSLSKADEKALSIISYIGCAISLVGLALTILTFAVFKNLRKKLPPQILICLSASLSAVLIIFVAGIEKTSPRAGCQVVAIALHYFLLATFLWMAVEAYNLYRCFVIVVGSHMSGFLRKVSLIAWGVPLVIVAISAGAGINYYGNDKHCMVTGLPLYIALAAPLAILLIINVIVFYLVLRGVSRNNVAKGKEISTISKARIGVACSVLLGLTWILGFLAVEQLSLPFQYLFCIFNSLQGFFIFLFYCLRNNDVRREWRKLCCVKDTGDHTSSNVKMLVLSKD